MAQLKNDPKAPFSGRTTRIYDSGYSPLSGSSSLRRAT